jgi:hypothetical protein
MAIALSPFLVVSLLIGVTAGALFSIKAWREFLEERFQKVAGFENGEKKGTPA